MLKFWCLLTLPFLVLSGCAADKVMHMGAGAVVGAVGGSCRDAWVVGIAKELYDATGAANVEVMDVVATGVVGCIVAELKK